MIVALLTLHKSKKHQLQYGELKATTPVVKDSFRFVSFRSFIKVKGAINH